MKITPDDNLISAIEAMPYGGVLELSEGIYRLKLPIYKNGITIRGAGSDKTRIVWDDYAKRLDSNGIELNTFRTWTCAVFAENVTMTDLAIENSAGSPEKLGQEVALTVYGDGFTMERCRLTSTQDTLFLGPLPIDLIERYDGFLPDELRLRKYCRGTFRDTLIEGTVDFIFGCGETVFENCELRSLRDARDVGYIAAPAHSLYQKRGFQFRNCRLTAESGVSDGSVFLARPWRDYGLCEFVNCEIGSHISPLGFDKWNGTERDKTARFYETPPVSGRVPWVRERVEN